MQAGLAPTVFNNGGCSSYYLDARGKNFAAWQFSTGYLRKRLSRFDLQNYHATAAAVASAAPAEDSVLAEA